MFVSVSVLPAGRQASPSEQAIRMPAASFDIYIIIANEIFDSAHVSVSHETTLHAGSPYLSAVQNLFEV